MSTGAELGQYFWAKTKLKEAKEFNHSNPCLGTPVHTVDMT